MNIEFARCFLDSSGGFMTFVSAVGEFGFL
jgi:hypothetical protein